MQYSSGIIFNVFRGLVEVHFSLYKSLHTLLESRDHAASVHQVIGKAFDCTLHASLYDPQNNSG